LHVEAFYKPRLNPDNLIFKELIAYWKLFPKTAARGADLLVTPRAISWLEKQVEKGRML